jgi:3-hydroxyacyl-CoA dehydrogenase
MSDCLNYEQRNGIAVLTVDNPPVNALGQVVRAALIDGIRRAVEDDKARAVLIRCAGRTFIAGADIREFDTGIGEPDCRVLFSVIERCPKPVVVAMHGTALGAGVELALACHYRCATADAKLGLPELTLGIIPGAGGTQRLPRLIGAAKALKFIMEARPVSGREAREIGLIDYLVEGDLADGALAWARELLDAGAAPRVTADLAVDGQGFDDAYIDACRQQAARTMRGQQAPERLVDAIRAAVELDFEAGLDRETQIGEEALRSDESKSLRHVFFAEREVARIPGLDPGIEAGTVAKVGIIGAGTMGGGIAMNFANAGIPVTILDAGAEVLEKGMAAIRRNYENSVKRGRLAETDLEQRMALIAPGSDYAELADADLVIEAVFEDMALKKEVFSRLSGVCRPDAILATNTSTLDIDEIASVVSRPEQVVGLHFFSPANVMKLVEIVRTARTSQQVLATSLGVARRIRKVGVVVGICYGFVGNRMMLDGYFREADLLLLEGATPEQVDRVLYEFGFAMGPCAVNDLGGMDIGYKARLPIKSAGLRPAPYHEAADALAVNGLLGQKSGAGFFRYEPGDRTPRPNPDAGALIAETAKRFGIERREVSDSEVLERCIYALINEGAKILEEGTAYRAGDIDVIWIYGYGFPRFRGGPMFHADTVGIGRVFDAVSDYHRRFGDSWKPAPLLETLAKSGGTFSGLDRRDS